MDGWYSVEKHGVSGIVWLPESWVKALKNTGWTMVAIPRSVKVVVA